MSLDFVPWACGIAHNHVRNFLRKRQNSQIQLDADVLEMIALRSQQMLQRESDREAALRECLKELTERNRVVIKSYYAGRSVADIAKARDATPNAIYKLLDRTRAILHQCVSNRLARNVHEIDFTSVPIRLVRMVNEIPPATKSP